MLSEEQISERRERARTAIAEVVAGPPGYSYGDYEIKSASGRNYRVAMRGPSVFENYCTCPDFAVNTLGTCKHIESLLMLLRERHGKAFRRQRFVRRRASVSLHYGDSLAVRLRMPEDPSLALRQVAEEYFDADALLRPGYFRRFGEVMDRLRQVDEAAVVYTDVLDYVEKENELAEGLEFERRTLAELDKGGAPLKGLLKVDLFPYQARGAIFAASRGRVALADDMGLGKTIQAIAAVELLRRRRGIERVLVIAPASVKYQWKTEIEKFSGLSAQVIDGPLAQRRGLYANPAFFSLTSYELVLKDFGQIQTLRPDVIVLDEAQRIRNWTTATARVVKQLKSRYAIVLTGTPLENKLEELYSVVEFVDGRRLGPAFRFLKEHRMEDEKGKLLGYKGLDQIHRQLQPILLRRTRQEVLTELPRRTDQIFRVRMTAEQAIPYQEQSDILARLVHKWERQGWLSEIDLKRITCCLQNMRMLCDSTFLYDKETNSSPKLEEFREIIRELALEEGRKVVVFSEYERMTHLAGEELDKLKIAFASLHGGVPSRKRGALLDRFRNDPSCRVFLSTDAGGVGLNLQAASAVINFEPPWNPARLEQRIGRVHRMGQMRPVQVIHLLTEGSIEERVWETLRLKKALFSGLFDGTSDEISFEKLGRKKMMEQIKEIFAGPPQPAPAAVPPQAAKPKTELAPQPDLIAAAAGLFEAGLKFLESLTPAQKTAAPPAARIRQTVEALVQTDPRTRRPSLAIPLPEGFSAERLAGSIEGFLSRVSRALSG
ncbi:MAG: DEAD/DEAH box helicase [Bryobacteraceae bacterium]|nr:DEAD/DEAH box helicase [Bryobacteraceae bacterium]